MAFFNSIHKLLSSIPRRELFWLSRKLASACACFVIWGRLRRRALMNQLLIWDVLATKFEQTHSSIDYSPGLSLNQFYSSKAASRPRLDKDARRGPKTKLSVYRSLASAGSLVASCSCRHYNPHQYQNSEDSVHSYYWHQRETGHNIVPRCIDSRQYTCCCRLVDDYAV